LTKILLLSDTHSHIDDTILKYVNQADEVWHAGDIGDLAVTDAIKKQAVQIAIRYGAELELEREFLYRGGEGADRYNVYKYLYKGIWYNEYEMNYHLPKNRPSVNIGIFLNFAQFLVPKDTAIFRIYGEPNPEAKKFITDILL
jgi:hypothetical protein